MISKITALLLVGFALITGCMEFGWFPLMTENLAHPWEAKEFLSLALAAAVCAIHLSSGRPIRFLNPWMLGLIAYLVIHPLITPKFVFNNPYDTLLYSAQLYKPLAQTLVYFLFGMTVASVSFTRKEIQSIISLFVWMAFLSAIYGCLQYMGWDQWAILSSAKNTLATSGKEITATISHPNQLGIFLAACVPFLLYRKTFLKLAVVLLCIAATESLMAYGGTVVAIGAYLFLKNPKSRILILGVSVFSVLGALVWVIDHPNALSGRGQVWGDSLALLADGRLITGFGFDAFRIIIPGFVGHDMIRMHNDPLQFLFGTGLIGISLLIMSIIWLIKDQIRNIITNEHKSIIGVSFLVLLACSLGSFVFQVEPLRIMGVFFIGYLHNKGA